MKIAVVGAGAMGSRFGVALMQGGADVVLCDVFTAHIDAINNHGLKVTDDDGVHYFKIKATSDVKTAGNIDALMIFTKSIHTEAALKLAEPILSGGAPVITLQNGLGNIEVLERTVGKDRIIAGVTDYPCDFVGPGEVNFKGSGYVKLMALGKAGEDTAGKVDALLKKAGLNCELSDNVMKEIWEKLAFNCAMNTITSVTRQRVREMGGSPYGFELCRLIAEEVSKVSAAEGVVIDLEHVIATFQKVIDPKKSGGHITSMLQDVLAGRQTEVDSICGSVVQRAKAAGIATPHLKTMYNLIKIVEENYATRLT